MKRLILRADIGKIAVAILFPLLSTIYLFYLYFVRIGSEGLAELLFEDVKFSLSFFGFLVGLSIWLARLTLPALMTLRSSQLLKHVSGSNLDIFPEDVTSESSLILGRHKILTISGVQLKIFERYGTIEE